MKKSLILFDIDGTLLQSEINQIPQSTLDAIYKLKEAGHELAVATGRALFLVDERIKELPFSTFVTANGQHIMHHGQVVYENAIPHEVVIRLVEEAKQLNMAIGLLSATRSTVTEATDCVIESFNRVSLPLPEVVERIHQDEAILQAWYFSDDFKHLPQTFKDDLRFVPWLSFGADIVPYNGSKAEGIKELMNHLSKKPEQVIAFGDGHNDIEMLQLADIGVAMGNASDEVKAHADFITKRIDENGIYYACEKLGLFSN
ncbi:MAG: Cof-type HAD-IIB family hydrolase [Turicibacter sp.]|nr:Cof-type HAD-IIB family hydrolase [Turicibacter sp.]